MTAGRLTIHSEMPEEVTKGLQLCNISFIQKKNPLRDKHYFKFLIHKVYSLFLNLTGQSQTTKNCRIQTYQKQKNQWEVMPQFTQYHQQRSSDSLLIQELSSIRIRSFKNLGSRLLMFQKAVKAALFLALLKAPPVLAHIVVFGPGIRWSQHVHGTSHFEEIEVCYNSWRTYW